ncbi:MAG: PAS domain S-box protein [Hahellaceae bacterium]|nr:PAS domain S-box protein [Hahellaceae bacterium]MCP5168391.1 PAS domain S-box protein [Hahellaceae bacterium]
MTSTPDGSAIGRLPCLSLEQLPDAVALTTCETESHYVAVNNAYCFMVGATPEALIGKRVDEHLLWTNQLQARAAREMMISGIPIDGLECQFGGNEGPVISTSVSVRRIELENKSYLIMSHRDVQQRVLIERQLRESEARWRFAVEGHGDGLWEWQVDNHQVYRSPHWLTMLKLQGAPTDVSLKEHLSVFFKEDLPEIAEEFQLLLAGKKEELFSQCRLKRADGQTIWVTFRCRVMEWNTQAQASKIIGTARDITETKMRQKVRDAQLGRLSHSARLLSLGEMASMLAHEINQPLGIISSYAGILMRKLGLESETGKLAGKIEEQALRAGKIVWRMRNFSRQSRFQPEQVDMRELIQESLEWLQADARNGNTRFDVDLPEQPLFVNVDRVLLEQLMLNLLRNAIQSMSDSTEKSVVDIRASEDKSNSQVIVEIADRGAGLSKQLSFDEFQPQPFLTTKADGVGLGLIIVHSILERHNGKLWSKAREGGGTCFYFSLPDMQAKGSQ